MKSPTVIFCNTNVVFDLTNLHYHTNLSTNLSGRSLGDEPQLAHPNLITQLLPTLIIPSRASNSDKLRVLLDTGSTSSFIISLSAPALNGV